MHHSPLQPNTVSWLYVTTQPYKLCCTGCEKNSQCTIITHDKAVPGVLYWFA